MESNQQIAGTADGKNIARGEKVQAEVGYDPQDPKVLFIAGFGIATIVGLVVVVVGIQAYFDHVKQQQVTEEVLRPVAEDLIELRTTEEGALNSYGYVDKENGVVRIPVSRAMELIAKESAAGQLQYFAKSYPVKTAAAVAAGPDGGQTSAANNNNPAVSANATAPSPNANAGTPGTSSNAPNSSNAASSSNGTNSSQSGKQ